MSKDQHILINLSGRGDKDIPTVARLDGYPLVERMNRLEKVSKKA